MCRKSLSSSKYSAKRHRQQFFGEKRDATYVQYAVVNMYINNFSINKTLTRLQEKNEKMAKTADRSRTARTVTTPSPVRPSKHIDGTLTITVSIGVLTGCV